MAKGKSKSSGGKELQFKAGMDVSEAKKNALEQTETSQELNIQADTANLDSASVAANIQTIVNGSDASRQEGLDKLMVNFDVMTRGRIIKELDTVKESYKSQYQAGTLSTEQLTASIATVDDQITSLENSDIFDAVIKAIEEYKKTIDEYKKAQEVFKSIQDAAATGLVNLTKADKDKAEAELAKAKADADKAKANLAKVDGSLDTAATEKAKTEKLTASMGSLQKITDASAAAVTNLGATFDKLGIGGEKLQVVLKDVAGIIAGAGELTKGIVLGDPVSIISGSVKILTSVIDLFNDKDRRLQWDIDKYKTQLASLAGYYKLLQNTTNNAVGEQYYNGIESQVENLKQQKEKIDSIYRTENDKKKPDKAKLQDYINQGIDLNRQISELNKAFSEALIQTNFKALSSDLADALTDAFAAGKDAAGKFDEVFDKVIVNAVKNSLKLKLLEPIVSDFTEALTTYAIAHERSVEGFDFEKWRNEIMAKGEEYTSKLNAIKTYFPEVDEPDPAAKTGISGVITSAGLTEDTANLAMGIWRGQYDISKQHLQVGTDHYKVALSHFNVSVEIASNTLRTANNTDGISAKLDVIAENTKPAQAAGDPFRNAGINLG